ncbi:MAG: hypothetical protein J5980_09455 [Muribaculaceae bacterium]|nr:hypothetical protein [Muribaculaceae bacterium]
MNNTYNLVHSKEELRKMREQLKQRLETMPTLPTGSGAGAVAQIRQQAEEAITKIKADADKEIRRLKDELSRKNEEIQAAGASGDSKAIELKSTIAERDRQITDLREAIATRDRRITDLEAGHRPAQPQERLMPLAFLLATRSGERTICPLYEGMNSFGRRRGRIKAEGHQEIDLSGDELEPRHFTINVDRAAGTLQLDDLIGNLDIIVGRNSLNKDSRFTVGQIEFEVFIK